MAALIAHRPEIENVSALQDLLNRNNRFTEQSQVDLFEAAGNEKSMYHPATTMLYWLSLY
jgi:hypothetical protein